MTWRWGDQMIETHMFNKTDRQCKRQARHSWLIVHWSRRCLCNIECDFVCECDRCFHSEYNKHILSEDFEDNQNTVASMTQTSACRDLNAMNQARQMDSHELTKWTRMCVVITWNSSREAPKLVQGKILEGGCSCYNTLLHGILTRVVTTSYC